MSKMVIAVLLTPLGAPVFGQNNQQGKWLDTTKDNGTFIVFDGGGKTSKPLIVEDYEVLETHEICATVYGYFLEKSQLGRYDVNFKGMRTSATFVFTTQYDAEKWVEKFCTADSLRTIKNGRGELARKY